MTVSARLTPLKLALATGLFALLSACGGDPAPLAPAAAPPPPPPAPAAQAWQVPVALESGTGYSYFSRIVVDAQGNAVATWEINGQIWASRYTPAYGWGAGMQLDIGGVDAEANQIAVDANGNVMALWVQRSGFEPRRLWSRRFTPAGGWETPAQMAGTDAGSGQRIAMDGAGNAIAVWTESAQGETLHASYYTAGAGWSLPVRVESNVPHSSNLARYARLAVQATGEALVVWEQRAGSQNAPREVWSNRYTPGSGWGAASVVGTGDWPELAIDAAGNAMVLMGGGSAGQSSVFFSRYSVETGWTSRSLLENHDDGQASNYTLTPEPGGYTTAAWSQDVGGTCVSDCTHLITNRHIPGVGWSEPHSMGATDQGSQSLAVDGSGKTILVWAQPGGNLVSSQRSAGGEWSATAPVREGLSGVQRPQIATNANGDTLAVWALLQSNGGVTSIDTWASVFK